MSREVLIQYGLEQEHGEDREIAKETAVEPGWPGKRATSAELAAHEPLEEERKSIAQARERAMEGVERRATPAQLASLGVVLRKVRDGAPPTIAAGLAPPLRELVKLEHRDQVIAQQLARRRAAQGTRAPAPAQTAGPRLPAAARVRERARPGAARGRPGPGHPPAPREELEAPHASAARAVATARGEAGSARAVATARGEVGAARGEGEALHASAGTPALAIDRTTPGGSPRRAASIVRAAEHVREHVTAPETPGRAFADVAVAPPPLVRPPVAAARVTEPRAEPPRRDPAIARAAEPREHARDGSVETAATARERRRAVAEETRVAQKRALEDQLAVARRAHSRGAAHESAPLDHATRAHEGLRPEARALAMQHAAGLVGEHRDAAPRSRGGSIADPRTWLARLRGEPEVPESVKPVEAPLSVPGAGALDYTPMSDAPAPLPRHGSGHAAAPPKLPDPPKLPTALESKNQQILDAYLEVARAKRQAARMAVQDQEKAKAARVKVDAAALSEQVQAANDQELVSLRIQAAQQRAAAEKAKAEAPKGPVTVESLKEKLETTARVDREAADQLFESKKTELQIRMDGERTLLADETAKQLAAIDSGQTQARQRVEQSWNAEKKNLEAHTKDAVRIIRERAVADQKDLEKQKDAIWKTANERADRAEADAKRAAKVAKKGAIKDAHELKKNAYAEAKRARDEGEQMAQQMLALARTTASFMPEDQRAGFMAQQEYAAFKVRSEARSRAKDFEIKGDHDEREAIALAKSTADKVRDEGERGKKKVEEATAKQIEATTEKVNAIKPLADAQVKRAEDDLKQQLDDGAKKLDEAIAPNRAKIEEARQAGEAKIAKAQADAEKLLAEEHDRELKAIDQRVELARKQLAHATTTNLAAMSQMVDRTCKALDKTVSDAEKKYDTTIKNAQKRAHDAVLAQLKQIEAEANKALDQIDAAYETWVKRLDQVIDRAYDGVDAIAKGKALEIEVHVATLLADAGDSTRYAAVRTQLAWYVEKKQPIPAGYGTKPPAPPKDPKDSVDAKELKAIKEGGKGEAAGQLEKLAKDEQAAKDEDKGKTEKEKAAPEEDKPLSQTEIDKKVDEAIAKGQTDTSLAAYASAEKSIQQAFDTGRAELKGNFTEKSKELQKLKDGDPEAVEAVAKLRHKRREAEDAADDLTTAAKKAKRADGKPDKKTLLAAIEGKDAEQLDAMRKVLAEEGLDLDDLIKDNLEGDDLDEAKVRLEGDPELGDIMAFKFHRGHEFSNGEKLVSAAGGIVVSGLVNSGKNALVDTERLDHLLQKYEGEDLKRFAKRYEELTGESFENLINKTYGADKAKQLGLVDDSSPAELQEQGEQAQKSLRAEAEANASDSSIKDEDRLHVDRCDRALPALVEAVGNKLMLDSTRVEKLEATLAGMSKADGAYLRASYRAKTGRDLDRDLDKALTGGQRFEAKALLSGDKARIAVAKVEAAEDGGLTPWTVSDDKMKAAMKELDDPALRREVDQEYKRRHGQSVTEMFDEKMTGRDRELATAYAKGERLKAAELELEELRHGGVMNGLHEGISERVGFDTQKLTRGLVDLALPSSLSAARAWGSDGKLVIGGYELENGAIHQVDPKQMLDLLATMPNPRDREQLRAFYKESTGRDMDADMASGMKGATSDGSSVAAYRALMDGKMDEYYAARMDAALDGLDDPKEFFKQLEGKPDWQRAQIIAAFNARHGGKTSAFLDVCDSQFGAGSLDAEKARLVLNTPDDVLTGKQQALPDDFILRYAQDSVWNRAAKQIDDKVKLLDKYPLLAFGAPGLQAVAGQAQAASYLMRGWGVDNDAIKGVLKGKSKAEIDELKAKYPDLERDLAYCLSGRDAFEVQLMLREGEPQTPKAKIERALALADFDRGVHDSTAWKVAGAVLIPGWLPPVNLAKASNAIVDKISPSGQMLDRQAAELRAHLAYLSSGGKLTPDVAAQIDSALGVMEASTTCYLEARQQITDAMATAVGAIVGAGVTVLTGGAAAPLLAALATGVSQIAVKAAMLGPAYGRNELGVDVAMTMVQMATAGLSLGGASQTFLTEVLNGGIGNAASAFVQTAITSKDAHDVLGLLAQASKAGVIGFASGAAGAVAQKAVGEAMEKLTAKAFGNADGVTAKMLSGFVSGGASNVATMFTEALADPSAFEGGWDQVFGNVARSFAEGGFQNALNDGAGAHREHAEQILHAGTEAAKRVQAEGGPAHEQQHAFVEKVAEGLSKAHDEAARESVARAPSADAPDAEARKAAVATRADELIAADPSLSRRDAERRARTEMIDEQVAHAERQAAAEAAVHAPESRIASEQGLADPAVVESFVDRVKGIEQDWSKLTPEGRERRLSDAINAELAAQGLPPMRVDGATLGEGRHGELDSESWTILIDRAVLERGELDGATMAAIANTALHEARHAEQWYLIARKLSEQGLSPADIRRQTRIPETVAAHAGKQAAPMTADQAAAADRFHHSIYGEGRAHREATLDALASTTEALGVAERELAAVFEAPGSTPEQRDAALAKRDAILAEAQQAYDAYTALPEEADAHAVGNDVEAIYHLASAKPTPRADEPAQLSGGTAAEGRVPAPAASPAPSRDRAIEQQTAEVRGAWAAHDAAVEREARRLAAEHPDASPEAVRRAAEAKVVADQLEPGVEHAAPRPDGEAIQDIREIAEAHERAVFEEARRLLAESDGTLDVDAALEQARKKVVEDEIALGRSSEEVGREKLKERVTKALELGATPAEKLTNEHVADALHAAAELLKTGKVGDKQLGEMVLNGATTAIVALVEAIHPGLGSDVEKVVGELKDLLKSNAPGAVEKLGQLTRLAPALVANAPELAFLRGLVHPGIPAGTPALHALELQLHMVREAKELVARQPELTIEEALRETAEHVNDVLQFGKARGAEHDGVVDSSGARFAADDEPPQHREPTELETARADHERAAALDRLAARLGEASAAGPTASDHLAIAEQKLRDAEDAHAASAAKERAVEARRRELAAAEAELALADAAANSSTRPGEEPDPARAWMRAEAEARVAAARDEVARAEAQPLDHHAPAKDRTRAAVESGAEPVSGRPRDGGSPDAAAHREARAIAELEAEAEAQGPAPLRVTAAPNLSPETVAKLRRPQPEQLAAETQRRANQVREDAVTPKQRELYAAIDALAVEARTPADLAYVRRLEAEVGRPVSERLPADDDAARVAALARDTSYGVHHDGTPVTRAQHDAAITDLERRYVEPQVGAKAKAHEAALGQLAAEARASIARKDAQVAERILEQLRTAPIVDGRKVVELDAAVSLGMGGAGAGGARGDRPDGHDRADVRTDRIGLEDATRPELWQTLGHKAMGQEAAAISYGVDGVRTDDLAEHPTAMPARASELALQVAELRDASGVGTLGTHGAAGPLEVTVRIVDGEPRLQVDIPVRVRTGTAPDGTPVFEDIVIRTTRGVDVATGMGPARELRPSQLDPEDARVLKERGALMHGEAALALPAEAFAGQRVLGIGGGATSEWAMEHALAGGASSVRVVGTMPRPPQGSPEAAALARVEKVIRRYVAADRPVPPELTRQHRSIVAAHVAEQRARLVELDTALRGELSVSERTAKRAERDRIVTGLDAFAGARVDRNQATLNDPDLTHLQADVIVVRPAVEKLSNGTMRSAIEVIYADGTSRMVDRVIPSIGADPDAPGGLNHLLSHAPRDLQLIPVISDGRCVGLESDPPGLSFSGAAMVGTMGKNMAGALMSRIPEPMRDAVVASLIEWAHRPDVSAGSRGIVPGIENVGANPELTVAAIRRIPAARRSAELQEFLDAHESRRGTP